MMIRTQRREREREINVIVKEYFSITYDTVSNIYIITLFSFCYSYH